ncbi:MAG: hypothetical protein LBG67_02560, partial [Campylobacteraceae bacterium]|nr:hypothetical protein [Campylobacteraceae bacterium]
MLENEFNFSDDLFGIQDINAKQDDIVEEETKKNFPKTVENLRAVLSFFDEIDGFVAKQMELFGILNVKFP